MRSTDHSHNCSFARYHVKRTCFVTAHLFPDHAGRTVDHATYMSARHGTADIFFPTDFHVLARMAAMVTGRPLGQTKSSTASGAHAGPRQSMSAGIRVMHSAEFLAASAQTDRTKTMTGYNPLLEDYRNTRFLLT